MASGSSVCSKDNIIPSTCITDFLKQFSKDADGVCSNLSSHAEPDDVNDILKQIPEDSAGACSSLSYHLESHDVMLLNQGRGSSESTSLQHEHILNLARRISVFQGAGLSEFMKNESVLLDLAKHILDDRGGVSSGSIENENVVNEAKRTSAENTSVGSGIASESAIPSILDTAKRNPTATKDEMMKARDTIISILSKRGLYRGVSMNVLTQGAGSILTQDSRDSIRIQGNLLV
eukprot:gnl/MRDRNA2_/MRDRNA2_182336_c0_seq1.p1 gnl/MRDRNA2_/MRDRNA2_182336_c0~~gnl/MRDRNA2_/MRDRNA2_182336_c0_seq1.p1  ORF type:complete len:234 (-),score=31.52 gnl/MRDRNA2_/MRDRNA2_182336_c0_seq1:424-1125(-)